MTPVAKFSTRTSALATRALATATAPRVFQIQDNGFLGLAQDSVKIGRAAGIATPWGLDLDDLGAHCRQVTGCGGTGDHPTEIEYANARQGQGASGMRCRRWAVWGQVQAKGRAGDPHIVADDPGRLEEATVPQLR